MINVLIVDDDRFARMGLISMIPWEEYGMKIVGEAANGRRALDFMRQNKVNLVFVDIAMPIMDGMQLIRQVKEEFKDVRFVVLSFHEEFEYVQEAFRLGALDYISKDRMEMEDYNGIMSRICANMIADGFTESDTDSEQLDKLEEQLAGVLWLYDNYQMDRVLDTLAGKNIHMRSLEKVLAAVTARISADTQVQFDHVPRLENAAQAANYLRSCRRHYHESIKEMNDSVHARLMMAAVYIWEKSAEQIQATEVANAVSYSRSYFSVSFKKVLGITFNAFVRRERIRNAMLLLQTTTLPQSEIARRCGYGDVSNFKNAFRDVTGGFPNKYRANRSVKEEQIAHNGADVG